MGNELLNRCQSSGMVSWVVTLGSALFVWLAGSLGPSLAWASSSPAPALAETVLPEETVLLEETVTGPKIVEIEWRIEGSLGRRTDLEGLLPIRVGDRLRERTVRRALSKLYASGLIETAEIHQRSVPEGIVLVVSLFAKTWVEEVNLEGKLGVPRFQLRKAIDHRDNSPLDEERVLKSVHQLMDLYAERGYREAEVKVEVERRYPGRVALIFRVESGIQARFGNLAFTGSETLPREALIKASRLSPGDAYSPERVEDARERLRKWLRKESYLSARVEDTQEIYDAEEQRIDLILPIVLGPRIVIAVQGAKVEKLKDQGFFSLLEEQSFDEAILAQICDRLKTHFQRQGFHLAEVSYEVEEQEEQILLQIAVESGALLPLLQIKFAGNSEFSDELLAELIQTSVRRPFKRNSGRLVTEDLEEDLANLQSFYVLQGFRQAKVGPVRVEELAEGLALTIEIDPGVKQRVVTIDFTGLAQFASEDLQARLPLQPGGPFHPVLVSGAVNSIRRLYEQEGFASISITPVLDWNDAETLVDVHFEIFEGQQQTVDRIFLRGQSRTREELIRRFISLEPGEPVHRARLLEVERDLYRLGIFSRVDVELLPISERPRKRDVMVRLEEGRRWRLAYGLSYHSDDGPGALLSVSRSNIGGRGDRLQLDLRGNENDARFRLLFDQPSIGRWKLPITYSIFRQRDQRESFIVDDLGARISVTRDFRTLRLGLLYDYRLVDLSIDLVDPSLIERQDRELEISSITPTLFVDRRDDPVDPTRGWNTILQLEYAFPFLKAEAEFVKLFWQQTHYANLGPLGVLAASFRFGGIEPLDPNAEPDELVPESLDSRLIPVSERFFAGGRTTHRAYRRDRLGIPGETLIDFNGESVEAGGNGLLLLNLDYRFPISDDFGGTFFMDFGNVWANWRDADFGDLRSGVGIGLRYRSPIGPLRLDIGWPIDPLPDDEGPAFFFSFGNPF